MRIVPRKCRLLPGATRTLLAKALDEAGHVIGDGIVYTWTVAAGEGSLSGEGSKVSFTVLTHIKRGV